VQHVVLDQLGAVNADQVGTPGNRFVGRSRKRDLKGIIIGEAIRRFKDRLSSVEQAKAQSSDADPG